MPARHPWPEVRAAYMEGVAENPDAEPWKRSWPTMAEVATLFGIPLNTVKAHAKRERWGEQREQFQADLERARRADVIAKRVAQATDVDDRGMSAAQAGLALVATRLTWLVARERQKGGEQGSGIDGRDLAALGLAAKRFVDVKAHVMGQPQTAPEDTLDELERQERIEERRIAAELREFIERRAAEQAEDDLQSSA